MNKEYEFTYEDEIVGNKKLREAIDGIIQEIKQMPTSRERSISITKLQEAVMWLGMDLKRLEEKNPYSSSKDTGIKIDGRRHEVVEYTINISIKNSM